MTIEDIRNPSRISGFDHVGNKNTNGHPQPHKPFQADVYGGKRDKAGRIWSGPARATAEEAAQDYCDYINGNAVTPAPQLRSAGHAPIPPRPKRVDDADLTAAWDVINAARAEDRDNPAGYVYLIAEEGPNPDAVKIGKSGHHPQGRLRAGQTWNPRKLVLLGFIETDDRHELEKKLHQKYIEQNILQEWFRPIPQLLSEFS